MRYIIGIIVGKVQYQMTKTTYIIRVISAMILLVLIASLGAFAQTKNIPQNQSAPAPNNIMLVAFPYNGETLPMLTLKEIKISAARSFKSEKDKLAWLKLKRDVKKAYPYAILASVKLREYDAIMTNMSEKERGPYLKKMYGEEMFSIFKEIKNTFDPQNIFNPHKKTDADLNYSLSHIRYGF